MTQNHFNVIVVGAGISGISAGYHLQKDVPIKLSPFLKVETLSVEHGICFAIRESDQTLICRLWVFGSNPGRD